MRKLTGILCAGLLITAACGGSKQSTDSSEAKDVANKTRQAASQPAASGPGDVIDKAVAAGQFNTLATALKAAGLIGALKGPGPFTVFAPTDAAFAKLPAGTVEDLLKPENKGKLTSILKYHVVNGKILAAQVTKMTSANTLQGGQINIKVAGGSVTLNDSAKVVQTDIGASNGVIHVIDTVIMPQ